VALIVMQNGGSTSVADRTFRNILRGRPEEGLSPIWRLDAVVVCGVADGRSWTILRPVGAIGVNLVRASEAVVLGERVARGEIDLAELDSETARIKALAPPYGQWTLIAAAACTCAFFSQIPGGDWGAFWIAFVAAGLGQFLRFRLLTRKAPGTSLTMVCGILSACVAALGVRLGLTQVAPATVIGSVVYMVPGLPLINGFVDVISHKYLLVGLERIANAVFLFLLLTIAIALADTFVL
jgi:uncharacterized membrane protein YjjP (DUF1212 family)